MKWNPMHWMIGLRIYSKTIFSFLPFLPRAGQLTWWQRLDKKPIMYLYLIAAVIAMLLIVIIICSIIVCICRKRRRQNKCKYRDVWNVIATQNTRLCLCEFLIFCWTLTLAMIAIINSIRMWNMNELNRSFLNCLSIQFRSCLALRMAHVHEGYRSSDPRHSDITRKLQIENKYYRHSNQFSGS